MVILLSRFESAPNALYFELAMSCNISKFYFNAKFFASVTSSGTSSSFLIQPLSSFMLASLLLLSPSGCISRVSQMVALLTLPQSPIFPITLFKFNSNFTFNVITFHFFAEFSFLLANSLFSLLILIKYHRDL